MAISFHVMAANGVLIGAVRERLDAVLNETAATCSALLDLPDLDVIVMNVSYAVIPRLGVGGTSYDAHQVVLWLDVEHEHLKTNFAQTIRSILAHELHHCAWAHARGGKFGETYGENLVLEGLACCFEEEIGDPTPFYALECKGADLERFSERARGQLSAARKSLGRSWSGGPPTIRTFPISAAIRLGTRSSETGSLRPAAAHPAPLASTRALFSRLGPMAGVMESMLPSSQLIPPRSGL